MSYTWEPKWAEYHIEANGIILRTCIDKITGLIACPICINAKEVCLDKSAKPSRAQRATSASTQGGSYFFTVDDLISHLKTYHLRNWEKRIEKILKGLREE